jgi:hypothetical protein
VLSARDTGARIGRRNITVLATIAAETLAPARMTPTVTIAAPSQAGVDVTVVARVARVALAEGCGGVRDLTLTVLAAVELATRVILITAIAEPRLVAHALARVRIARAVVALDGKAHIVDLAVWPRPTRLTLAFALANVRIAGLAVAVRLVAHDTLARLVGLAVLAEVARLARAGRRGAVRADVAATVLAAVQEAARIVVLALLAEVSFVAGAGAVAAAAVCAEHTVAHVVVVALGAGRDGEPVLLADALAGGRVALAVIAAV